MQVFATLTKENTKHLYDIETVVDGKVGKIEVQANTRSQAAKIAEKAGYVVNSVNMVG